MFEHNYIMKYNCTVDNYNNAFYTSAYEMHSSRYELIAGQTAVKTYKTDVEQSLARSDYID